MSRSEIRRKAIQKGEPQPDFTEECPGNVYDGDGSCTVCGDASYCPYEKH